MGNYKVRGFFCSLFLLMFGLSFPAAAQPQTWDDQQKVIESLLSEYPLPCDRLWDAFWPWFKQGEPDVILGLLMGSVGLGVIHPPLLEDENMARTERFSLTVYEVLARGGKLQSPVAPKVSEIPVKTVDDYLVCTHKFSEEDCAETALALGSVPAFDDFVATIEKRLNDGQKQVCPAHLQKQRQHHQ